MLCDRPQHDGGQESQRPDKEHRADQYGVEQSVVGPERAERLGHPLLADERSGDRQHDDHGDIASEQHDQPRREVPERRVVGQAFKAGSVIRCGRRILVEDLRDAVRAGVRNGPLTEIGQEGNGGRRQDDKRMSENRDGDQLHFPRLDLPAQELRRPSDHESAQEHAQDRVHQHIDETDAFAAEHDVQHHFGQGPKSAERSKRIVHIVDRSRRRCGRYRGEQRGLWDAEANLLAFHAALGSIDAQSVHRRVAAKLREINKREEAHEQSHHRAEHDPALLGVLREASVNVRKRRGQQPHRQDLDHVRQSVRILERVSGVSSEEAAAVGAKVLDRFQRGDRADGDVLRSSFECLYRQDRVKRLRHLQRNENQGNDDRSRDKNAGMRLHEVFEEVPDGRALAGHSANEGDGDREPCRGRREHHHHDHGHLREVRQARLAAVMLQVRVRHEADDRVEAKRLLHVASPVRVKRQVFLQTQDQITYGHQHDVRQQKADGIPFPSHAGTIL